MKQDPPLCGKRHIRVGTKTKGYSSWEKVARAVEKADAERTERRGAPAPPRPTPSWAKYAVPDPVAHVMQALSRQRVRRAAEKSLGGSTTPGSQP